MIFDSLQIVCSLGCLNTMLRLLLPGPNLGMVVWAPAGLDKTLFLSDFLLLLLGTAKLAPSDKDLCASAFLCSFYFLINSSLYFLINSFLFKHHSSCVLCTKVSSMWAAGVDGFQQQWQMSSSFACCHTWNFAVHKDPWSVTSSSIWAVLGSWPCLLGPSGLWWQPASWKTR